MRGGFLSYVKQNGIGRYTDAVEAIKREHAESCEQRLARIQNGSHPDFQNGTPFPAEDKKKKGKRKTY